MAERAPTKSEWVAAFGGSIICPCCYENLGSRYSKGHKHDCTLVTFNARMSLVDKAPR